MLSNSGLLCKNAPRNPETQPVEGSHSDSCIECPVKHRHSIGTVERVLLFYNSHEYAS